MLHNDSATAQKIVLAGIAACFVIETGSNAVFGFRYAGGASNFLPAIFMGAASIAVAVIGAFLSARWIGISWKSPAKYVVAAIVLACFTYSFTCGVRLIGVTMADGGAARDRAAKQGAVAGDKLAKKEQARAALGNQPDPAQIEAAIAKELAIYVSKADKTVGVATKDCADPSWAPKACTRVADLRVKLADARQAKDLDAEIEAAATGLGKAPVVAGGDPDLKVLAAITFQNVDDVKFILPVAIVGLMTVLANFGLALVSISGAAPLAPETAPRPQLAWRPEYPYPDQSGPAPWHPSGGGHPAAHPQHLQQVPSSIQIFTGSSAPLKDAEGMASAALASASTGSTAAPAAPPVQTSAPPHSVSAHRAVLPVTPAPAAPSAPVDRRPANEAVDRILTFQAACLRAGSGDELLPVARAYERYARWAQGRAVGQSAFQALLEAAGLVLTSIGGEVHLVGQTLREERARLAVAG